MDAMVSARVPVEIKKQGDKKLREIGATTTELVNSAYVYLLDNGRLPGGGPSAKNEKAQVKTLSGSAAVAFRQEWRRRAMLDGLDSSEGFREALNQARDDYYARLT